MRDEEKPFIYYKTGRWSFKIAPRNRYGVRATLLWLLALFPVVGLFLLALRGEPANALVGLYTLLYLAAMLLWSISMMRWMKARSEIVDMEELLAIKRERDAANKRRGR